MVLKISPLNDVMVGDRWWFWWQSSCDGDGSILEYGGDVENLTTGWCNGQWWLSLGRSGFSPSSAKNIVITYSYQTPSKLIDGLLFSTCWNKLALLVHEVAWSDAISGGGFFWHQSIPTPESKPTLPKGNNWFAQLCNSSKEKLWKNEDIFVFGLMKVILIKEFGKP